MSQPKRPAAHGASARAAAALAAALLLCAPVALAHEAVDLGASGSITLELEYGGQAVAGGTFALFRVGDAAEDDGDYSFTLAEGFEESGLELDADALSSAASSSELASELAAWAEAQGVEGEEAPVSADGTLSFEGLAPGLYLLVQGEAAEGFEAASPFLVSVPMDEGGAYLYDVDASPKVSLVQAEEEEPEETVEETEETEEETAAETSSALPKTADATPGAAPAAAAGLALLAGGAALVARRRATSVR